MQTFSIYRYRDCSLSWVKDTVNNFTEWNNPVNDPITGGQLEFGYEMSKEMSIDLKTEKIQCLYLEFRSEKLSNKHKNNPDRGKRIRRNDVDAILFEEGNDLIVIPLKGKNYVTASIIRTALNINGENQLVDNPFNLKEDLFYWIFNQYLNFKNITVQQQPPLIINSLTGFTGETRDTINTINGSGSRVSEILWTLAFLFTNESLKSITPELTHIRNQDGNELRETIKLELTLNGSYKIDESGHTGTQFFNNVPEEKISYLLIYAYKILIPKLQSIYSRDSKKQIWSPYVKMQFITSIGSEIQDQVESILQSINNDLDETEE